MANPMVRCFPEDYSNKSTKWFHRNIDGASMIQSIPAANHKTGELGIINNAAEAK
jgi:hypothetical protein